MEAAAHQVFLARKFYNDLAAATDARRRPLARVFRLAGSAPPPEFFEMDDALSPRRAAPPRPLARSGLLDELAWCIGCSGHD